MVRAILIALAVAGCSEPSVTSSRSENSGDSENSGVLVYPVEPPPREFVLAPGPATDDYEAVSDLFESAEPEMVRLRRPMTPIIVKIDNLPEDGIVWTVLSFQGAMDENFTGPWFEGRWIARRVRKGWSGQTLIDWADSDHCAGFVSALSRVVDLRPPNIESPDPRALKINGAKTTVVLDREFTLWTTWAPSYDLRFGGNSRSEVGQWAISVALALHPCWTTIEPQRPGGVQHR